MAKFTITAANKLAAKLDAAKLDKHGKRIRASVQKVIDGGADDDWSALVAQANDYLANGAPVETKSSRRRTPIENVTVVDGNAFLALVKAESKAKPAPADKATIEGKSAAKVARTKARAAAKLDVAAPALKQVRNADGASVLVANPDRIREVKPTTPIAESRHMVVTSEGGDSLIVPNERNVGDVRKLAVVGGSLRAVRAAFEAAKGEAKLANGITGRDAPHASKAVADRRAAPAAKALEAAKAHLSGKATPKVAAKPAPAKEARKAERAAKAAPKGDDTRKITIVDKAFTFGAAGSKRRASWDAVRNGATVADYAKAGGALKYLPRWVSAGAIKLG